MARKYETHQIDWNGITIQIRYCSAWLSRDVDGFNIAHLEIKAVIPDRARLPMADTGYHSHFRAATDIAAYKGPVGFVTAWLEHEAQSKDWQDYLESSKQGELF